MPEESYVAPGSQLSSEPLNPAGSESAIIVKPEVVFRTACACSCFSDSEQAKRAAREESPACGLEPGQV